jgi:hypothetical protein
LNMHEVLSFLTDSRFKIVFVHQMTGGRTRADNY